MFCSVNSTTGHVMSKTLSLIMLLCLYSNFVEVLILYFFYIVKFLLWLVLGVLLGETYIYMHGYVHIYCVCTDINIPAGGGSSIPHTDVGRI